jgi:phosphoglycolate phosphatase-like HAD superfamily hydrolase
MIKNIIWDFDGTLFDTYPDIIKTLQHILTKNHAIFLDDIYIEKLVKVDVSHCAEIVGRENNIDGNSLFDKFLDFYFTKGRELPRPFANVEEILEYFISTGMNFLVTHRNRETTFEILDAYSMTGYFKEIIVAEDGYEPKPSPQSFNYLIDKYGLSRNETLGIGDRDLDVMAAINSGIVSCFFDEKKEHDKAAYNVSSYDEFKRIIISPE